MNSPCAIVSLSSLRAETAKHDILPIKRVMLVPEMLDTTVPDILPANENGLKHTHTHEHTKSVLNRLARAIGHLTAVRGMVEDGRDCSEVLTQLAAVRSAINSTCEVILKDHLEHCIVDAVKSGDMTALDELNSAVELLLK